MPLSRLAFGPAPRSGRKVFVAERRAQGEIVTFRLVSTRTNMAVSALMPTAKVPITSAVKPDFWGAGDETRMSLGISASAIYGSRRCSRAQYFSDEWACYGRRRIARPYRRTVCSVSNRLLAPCGASPTRNTGCPGAHAPQPPDKGRTPSDNLRGSFAQPPEWCTRRPACARWQSPYAA